MNIICNRLDDWEKQLSGAGSVTITNNVATCVDGGSSDRAYIRKYVRATGGSKIKVRFSARATSGEPRAVIDACNRSGTVISSPALSSVIGAQWCDYELECSMPFEVDDGSFFQVNLGVFSTQAGTCEIANVSITVIDNGFGAIRCYGMGLLRKIGSTYDFSNFYAKEMIGSVTADPSNNQLVITLDQSVANSPSFIWPLPFISVARPTNNFRFIPTIGNFEGNPSRYFIRFLDSSTGVQSALPTGDYYLSIAFLGG